MGSQEENAPGNSLCFKAQIEDLGLKCCILKEDFKNTLSGKKYRD
jgi:hypothetical protein